MTDHNGDITEMVLAREQIEQWRKALAEYALATEDEESSNALCSMALSSLDQKALLLDIEKRLQMALADVPGAAQTHIRHILSRIREGRK